MLSAKTLFLGVYTANGILSRLFVPVCYVFSLSPFGLLFLRYSGLGQKLLDSVPQHYRTPDIWPQIFLALIALLLATRVASRRDVSGVNGTRRVQLLPYWIPGAKHWWNLVFGGEKWLKSIRDTTFSSTFAYIYSGTKHNVVLSPALMDVIAGNTDSFDEADVTEWALLRNAFGLPAKARDQYLQLRSAITATLDSEIFSGQQLKTMSATFAVRLSEALPDLITFNSSIVDQFPWERVSGTELTDGTDEAECDFFALVNEFFCLNIVPLITGPQFLESYELLATDLATLNQHFFSLSLGLPRFFPIPGLPTASLSKKRLLKNLNKLLNEMTNPPVKRDIPDDESMSGDETDADTPTPLTALNKLFSDHNLPIPVRAAITLELLHRITSKAVPLAFWTLLHIYQQSTSGSPKSADGTPVTSIRKETEAWAQAVQPPSIHPSFPSPPEISFSYVSPMFNPSIFTYLRSCIFESRRLYTSSITTAKVTKPIVVTDNSDPKSEAQWQLDRESYIDFGLSRRLINTSPAEYISPETYKPGRYAHVQSPAPLASTVFNNSDELVTAMLVAFVTGVVQLWEIGPAPSKGLWEQMQEAQAMAAGQDMKEFAESQKKRKGEWVLPKAVDGGSVLIPKNDVRVRIRRREKLPEKRTILEQ